MIQIPQSTPRTVSLKLFSTGTTTPATGKTVAVTVSKAGGAFANPNAGATNATEVSNGWYQVALDATDTNTLGDLVVRGTAAGCDDSERVFGVVAATSGGLTNLDAAVSSRMATFTLPANFSALSITGGGHVANVDTLTTYTGNTPQTGDVATVIAKLPANAIADETLVIAATNSILTAVGSPMQAGASVTLTSAYDFAKGTVAVTESYAANGAAPTPAQALLAIHQMLMDFSISGTSLTVKKLDNATTAFVVTLDGATSPTGAART